MHKNKLNYILVMLLYFLWTTACGSAPSSTRYIKKNVASFNGQTLPEGMFKEIKGKKIVLFGEGHGIKELPHNFYLAVKELSKEQPIIVGLEFPKNIQSNIDNYFKNGNISTLKKVPFFTNSNYHSGRASVAMIELLKKLRDLNNVTPFCFDVPESDSASNNRDTLMAKNLVEKANSSGSQPIVLLTGNIHSRLTPGVPWDPKYPTMGAEILRLSSNLDLNNVTNVLFRYSKGSAWQCRMENNKINCNEYPFGPSKSPYAIDTSSNHYFLKEENIANGHYNTLFIREVGASFPYFK